MSNKPVRHRKFITYSIVFAVFGFVFFVSTARAQTVPHKLGPISIGGSADDPAIWIHPTNSSKSLMFLSDKGGIIGAVDYTGKVCQKVTFGTSLNNIDVRYGFNFGGQQIDIVAGNLRGAGKLAVVKINSNHNCNNDVLTILAGASSAGNSIQGNSYGFTLYRRPSDGTVYVFDKPKSSSPIKQWKVDGSSGSIQVTAVRTISDVGIGVAEGFVADDALGFVYFAEETKGVHKYNADPNASNKNRLSFFASGDGTASDREGIALYPCNNGTGYLVLSSQGNSKFMVYDRAGSNTYRKTFTVSNSSGTDGLDVSPFAVTNFPSGFGVIHNGGSGYYVVDWADIANLGSPSLSICVNGGGGGVTITQPPTPTPPPGCTKPGDANCDGKVDGFDYVTWWQNFGKNVTGGPSKGDFNNSGFVDGFDYVIWWQNFGK